MKERLSIFGFNHISKNLTPDELDLLYNLYYRYHRKMWCYKRLYLTMKRKDLALTAASAIITTGGLAGTTIFLPAVAIGACGIVLGVIAKKKNYPRKVELLRYAYTSYEKVLHKLRAYLRGEVFEPDVLTHELNILEDNISDLCPPIENEKYERQYEKIFDTSEIERHITHVRVTDL